MGSKRIAICIGINEYKNFPEKNLLYAVSDAEKVYSVFENPERGVFEPSYLLIDKHATKEAIINLLEEVLTESNLNKDDLVLFYFSGHAKLDHNDDLYLIPYNVKPQKGSPEKVSIRTTIHITEIYRALGNTQAGSVIFIIDACHSGASGRLLGNLRYKENDNIVFVGSSRFYEEAFESNEIEQSRFTLAFLDSFNEKPTAGKWITLQQSLSLVDKQLIDTEIDLPDQRMQTTSKSINQNLQLVMNPSYSLEASHFVDEVQELYELIDSILIEDFPISLPQNFFVVQSPGVFKSLVQTLVMCFYNETAEIGAFDVNIARRITEQVMEETLVKDYWIITEKEINESIKSSFGNRFTIKTIAQIRRSLINFDQYLRALNKEYRTGNEDRPGQPPLKDVYVSLDVRLFGSYLQKSPSVMPVEDAIDLWIKHDSNPFAVILGSYGTGKTTVGRITSYRLAEKIINGDIETRIPVFIPLRGFAKFSSIDMASFLVSQLRKVRGLRNIDYPAFERMNHDGLLLIIFDGFDEMSNEVDRFVLEKNFLVIFKMIRTGREKIIVTSRPEAFLTRAEQREIFSSVESYNPDFHTTTMHMTTFTDKQFDLFLQKRVQSLRNHNRAIKDWGFYKTKIKSIPDLEEVAKRPVLLEITISTLPKLLNEGVSITKSNLYEYYLDGEIKRQFISKERDFMIRDKDFRLGLSQHIALFMIAKETNLINVQDIRGIVKVSLSNSQQFSAEAYTRDYIACSFLVREEDDFRFSHLSFVEFLVARHLYKEIINNEPNILSRIRLKPEIARFLANFILDLKENTSQIENTLWQWMSSKREVNRKKRLERKAQKQKMGEGMLGHIVSGDIVTTRAGTIHYYHHETDEVYKIENLFSDTSGSLGGNAITLLSLIGKDFKHADLSDMNLSYAFFDDIDLANADLTGTYLNDSQFERLTMTLPKKGKVLQKVVLFDIMW